jgi:hypothetical protein
VVVGIEIQAAAVELDGVDEILLIAEAEAVALTHCGVIRVASLMASSRAIRVLGGSRH